MLLQFITQKQLMDSCIRINGGTLSDITTMMRVNARMHERGRGLRIFASVSRGKLRSQVHARVIGACTLHRCIPID